MKRSVIYEKAARILINDGWCTGKLHEEGDGYCIMGAILKATGISDTKLLGENGSGTQGCYDKFPDLSELVAITGVVESHEIWKFNDDIRRTKTQVIAALRKAAKNARRAGR